MYVKDGEYQGTYANVDTEFTSIPAEPSEDFGLDAVEPLFFHPLGDWETYGPFAIVLNFNVADIQQDVFYFCHVRKSTAVHPVNNSHICSSNETSPRFFSFVPHFRSMRR